MEVQNLNHWTAREVMCVCVCVCVCVCFGESLWYRISYSIYESCFSDLPICLGSTNSLQEVTGYLHWWVWHVQSELRDVQ